MTCNLGTFDKINSLDQNDYYTTVSENLDSHFNTDTPLIGYPNDSESQKVLIKQDQISPSRRRSKNLTMFQWITKRVEGSTNFEDMQRRAMAEILHNETEIDYDQGSNLQLLIDMLLDCNRVAILSLLRPGLSYALGTHCYDQ